jgi:hypothetical protein
MGTIIRKETRKTVYRHAVVYSSIAGTDSWRASNKIGQGTKIASDEEQANLLPIICYTSVFQKFSKPSFLE